MNQKIINIRLRKIELLFELQFRLICLICNIVQSFINSPSHIQNSLSLNFKNQDHNNILANCIIY